MFPVRKQLAHPLVLGATTLPDSKSRRLVSYDFVDPGNFIRRLTIDITLATVTCTW